MAGASHLRVKRLIQMESNSVNFHWNGEVKAIRRPVRVRPAMGILFGDRQKIYCDFSTRMWTLTASASAILPAPGLGLIPANVLKRNVASTQHQHDMGAGSKFLT